MYNHIRAMAQQKGNEIVYIALSLDNKINMDQKNDKEIEFNSNDSDNADKYRSKIFRIDLSKTYLVIEPLNATDTGIRIKDRIVKMLAIDDKLFVLTEDDLFTFSVVDDRFQDKTSYILN